MQVLYFGISHDGELMWFRGERVKSLKQIDRDESDPLNRHLFELEYEMEESGPTIFLLDELTVLQTTGEIQKVIDCYDRANNIDQYLNPNKYVV